MYNSFPILVLFFSPSHSFSKLNREVDTNYAQLSDFQCPALKLFISATF